MKEEVFLFANYRHKTNHEVFVINQEIVVYKSQTLTNKNCYHHKGILGFCIEYLHNKLSHTDLQSLNHFRNESHYCTSKQKATAIPFGVRAVRSTVLYYTSFNTYLHHIFLLSLNISRTHCCGTGSLPCIVTWTQKSS